MSLRSSQTGAGVIVRGGYYYRPERPFTDDDPTERNRVEGTFGPERLRRMDPLCQCALFAVHQARADAGIDRRGDKLLDEGICVGTAFGAQTTRVRYARRVAQQGPAATNPIDFPDSIDGAPAAHIAIYWGLQGPSLTFVDGGQSAHQALVEACRSIVDGRAGRVTLVTGDIFDPWLRQSIRGDARPSDRGSGEAESVSAPRDAVLALVLERSAAPNPGESTIEVVGFQGAPSAQPEPDVTGLIREVTTPTKDFGDLSGTSLVAGAWLGVVAPMGSQDGSWQDDDVSMIGWRCLLGVEQYPRLAFLRKKQAR